MAEILPFTTSFRRIIALHGWTLATVRGGAGLSMKGACVLATLLTVGSAEQPSSAQTFTPKAPDMELHPKADSTVWLLGSLDFGGGSKRLGALFAAYGGEAHLWFAPRFGVSLRATAFGAGEPDGGGADGKMFTGAFSARTKLIALTRQSMWLFGSLGGGVMTASGYERRSTDPRFDERFAVITARGGVLGEYGPLAFGGALEAFVAPGKGLAISPAFLLGLAF